MLKHILSCLPDFICAYRAAASVATLIIGIHPAAPWLFASALLSDLFDGYLYRHYTKFDTVLSRRPYQARDPWADFTLIICGSIYAMRYYFRFTLPEILLGLAVIAIISAILHAIPYIGRPRPLVYTICTTFMTHISCFVMLATTVTVWLVNSGNGRIYASATIVLFYAIFIAIGEKSRLIRRPPAGWRGL